MNYTAFTATILAYVLDVMRIINNPEISPAVRQRNQEILFREVGESVYAKVYDMNAWDYDIHYTTGAGIDTRYYGLAKNASDSISAGGAITLEQQVENYINQMIAKAQEDATKNALQSGKTAMIKRSVTGRETCTWCDLKATDWIPADTASPEIYYRHRKCDCEIWTEGFKSRNGLLNNYVKEKKV